MPVPVVDRLGRYGPTGATWDGTRLDEIARTVIRERILVADQDAHLATAVAHDVPAPSRRSACRSGA